MAVDIILSLAIQLLLLLLLLFLCIHLCVCFILVVQMLFVNCSLQRSIITVLCAAMQRLSFFIGLVCWMPSVHCSKFVVCGAAMQSGTHSSDVTTLITNWPLHCDYA